MSQANWTVWTLDWNVGGTGIKGLKPAQEPHHTDVSSKDFKQDSDVMVPVL